MPGRAVKSGPAWGPAGWGIRKTVTCLHVATSAVVWGLRWTVRDRTGITGPFDTVQCVSMTFVIRAPAQPRPAHRRRKVAMPT